MKKQIKKISEKILKPKIACLGLSFKPNIDDLRVNTRNIKNTFEKGHKVFAVDPNIISHKEIPILSLHDALENSDIICILVNIMIYNTQCKRKISKIWSSRLLWSLFLNQLNILLLSFYYPPDIGPGSLRAASIVDALVEKGKNNLKIDVLTTMPNRYSSYYLPIKKTNVR